MALEARTSRLDPGTLSRLRWARDPQGLDRLVERLTGRAVALTDDQVEAVQAALAGREGGPCGSHGEGRAPLHARPTPVIFLAAV